MTVVTVGALAVGGVVALREKWRSEERQAPGPACEERPRARNRDGVSPAPDVADVLVWKIFSGGVSYHAQPMMSATVVVAVGSEDASAQSADPGSADGDRGTVPSRRHRYLQPEPTTRGREGSS